MLSPVVNQQPATENSPLPPCPVPIARYTLPPPELLFRADGTEDFVTTALRNPDLLIYQESQDGIRRVSLEEPGVAIRLETGPLPVPSNSAEDLVAAIKVRRDVSEGPSSGTRPLAQALDGLAKDILILPRSERWREAVSTALLGEEWVGPLFQTGYLPATALGTLKAEARLLHRQLVPIWRRRTQHGRVLSLDAELGGGLSLYDLVAADIDLLARATVGVFEDERLNAVLRSLTLNERRVVLARAYGEGLTWAEAAAAAGMPEPKAFGEGVRRKTRRLADEQRRRLAQRSVGSGAAAQY